MYTMCPYIYIQYIYIQYVHTLYTYIYIYIQYVHTLTHSLSLSLSLSHTHTHTTYHSEYRTHAQQRACTDDASLSPRLSVHCLRKKKGWREIKKK